MKQLAGSNLLAEIREIARQLIRFPFTPSEENEQETKKVTRINPSKGSFIRSGTTGARFVVTVWVVSELRKV
jgi:hypothetical protein